MSEQRNEKRPARPTRRDFLKSAGLATAGLLVTDLARSRAYSLAAPRVLGANDRIRFGLIGVGPQGAYHLRTLLDIKEKQEANIDVSAVCEIYKPRQEAARATSGARLHTDYRALLADENVDVVLIATPEHWHARMACDAMEAGKDVYLEKPLSRTLDEAKQVKECVARTGRVLQVGAQWSSQPKWRRAHALLEQIGHPVWSQTSYCRNSIDGEWNTKIEAECTPETLDWKAFLGPAPDRPFDPDRFFRWRKYWDYSAGILGDLLPHKLHQLFIALGPELPNRVVSTGGLYVHKDREVPDMVSVLADFPRGHSLFAVGATCNEYGVDDMIRGHKGTMLLQSDRQIVIKPERIWAEELEGGPEEVETLTEDPLRVHQKNFIDCVRSRKMPNCGIDVAYPVMVTLALAEMAFRANKTMRYDPQKEAVIS